MAPFTKLFPFLQRFHFPPHGEPLNPREVGDELALVHEMFRADVKHNIRTRDSNASGAGAGADITLVPFENPGNHNFVTIPLWGGVQCDGVAGTQQVVFGPTNSGDPNVPTLPFAVWTVQECDYLSLVDGADRWLSICTRLPLMKGRHLGARFIAVPLGRTVRARGFWVEIPLETFDWATFLVSTAHRSNAEQA